MQPPYPSSIRVFRPSFRDLLDRLPAQALHDLAEGDAEQTKIVVDFHAPRPTPSKMATKASSCTELDNADCWTREAYGKVFGDKKEAKEILHDSAAT